MEEGAPDWIKEDAPVYLRPGKGSDAPYIRRGENEEPNYTPEEELRLIKKQIDDSQGFDIDFKQFRSVFNYLPLNLEDDDYTIPSTIPQETNRELMERLSRDSLADYNEKKGSDFELANVIKANLYKTGTAATMYYITFEAKDPSSSIGQPKTFQAKVCHFYCTSNQHFSCDLVPSKKVH